MSEASIVLTTLSIITIIFQIVIVIKLNYLKNRIDKKAKEMPVIQNTYNQHNRKDINNSNERKDRRPPIQNKPQSTQNVTVEKSLRDINLKLKNAERDQDKARKRMNPHSNNDSQKNQKRGNRDQDSKRQMKRFYDHNNNNAQNNGSQQKTDRFSPENETNANPPYVQAVEKNTSINEPIQNTAVPIEVKNEVESTILHDEQLTSSENQNESSYGRGSKITVRRRSLQQGKEESFSGKSEGVQENFQESNKESLSSDPELANNFSNSNQVYSEASKTTPMNISSPVSTDDTSNSYGRR